MASEEKEGSGEKIRNKIAVAEPNFSLSIESDECLAETKKVFNQLMRRYKTGGEESPKEE